MPAPSPPVGAWGHCAALNVGTAYQAGDITSKYDSGGFFDGGNPTRVTIPEIGWYCIIGHTSMDAQSITRLVKLRKNGSTDIATNEATQGGAGGTYLGAGVFYAGCFQEGDYVEMMSAYASAPAGTPNSAGPISIFRLPSPAFIGTFASSAGDQTLTQVLDESDWFTSGTTLTVDADGVYLAAGFAKTNGGANFSTAVEVNGASTYTARFRGGASANGYAPFCFLLDLTNGDTVGVSTTGDIGEGQLLVASITSGAASAAATQSSSTSIAASGTDITFNTEEVDTDAFHSTVTNNDQVVIPTGKAGVYLVAGNMCCTSFLSVAATLKLNTTEQAPSGNVNSRGEPGSVCIAMVHDLIVGDVLEARLAHDAGSAQNTVTDANMLVASRIDDWTYSWIDCNGNTLSDFVPRIIRYQ